MLSRYFKDHGKADLNGGNNPPDHLGRRLPVDAAHPAPLLRMPAAGVPHHLINHAARDSGVL